MEVYVEGVRRKLSRGGLDMVQLVVIRGFVLGCLLIATLPVGAFAVRSSAFTARASPSSLLPLTYQPHLRFQFSFDRRPGNVPHKPSTATPRTGPKSAPYYSIVLY